MTEQPPKKEDWETKLDYELALIEELFKRRNEGVNLDPTKRMREFVRNEREKAFRMGIEIGKQRGKR